jgi:O-antigen/teichoic acid export membrane protein
MTLRPLQWRFRNVATLGGANVLALCISLVAVPVLSRLYAPRDYGAFAVVTTIGSLVAPLASLAYQDAIILSATNVAAINLVALCLTFAMLSATISAGLLISCASSLTAWLQFTEHPRVLLFAVPAIFLSGTAGPLANLANREQRYRLIAMSRLASALVTTSTSAALSYLNWGAVGLLMATVAGALTTLLILCVGLRSTIATFGSLVTRAGMLEQARFHVNFPRYTLPTNFINSVTDNLPRTLLASMFGEATLGLFTRASSLLALPTQVVGAPIAEIFRRDLSKLVNEGADSFSHFRRTARLLAAVASAGLVVTLLTAPWVFPLVLGPKWKGTGEFAQVLAPMFAFRLVNAPLSFVVFLVRQHRFDLLMTILLLPMSLGSMAIAFLLFHSSLAVVATYSGVYTVTSVYMLYKNFQFAGHMHLVPNEIQSRHA